MDTTIGTSVDIIAEMTSKRMDATSICARHSETAVAWCVWCVWLRIPLGIRISRRFLMLYGARGDGGRSSCIYTRLAPSLNHTLFYSFLCVHMLYYRENLHRNLERLVERTVKLVSFVPDPLGLSFTPQSALRDLLNELRVAKASPRVRIDTVRYFWQRIRELRPRTPSSQPRLPRSSTKMAKRKFSGPRGIAAAKRARNNYGATPALERAMARVARKTEMRMSETLYSQSSFRLDTSKSTLVQSGFNCSGLNQSQAPVAGTISKRNDATNQCYVFPISPLSQLGNQGLPGFRGGSKINAKGLRISIMHYQHLASQFSTYHWAIIRDKAAVWAGPANAIPGITQTNAMQLFQPLSFGPLANAGGPAGPLPSGDFSSCMRRNTGDWAFVKSGTWRMQPEFSRTNTKIDSDPTAGGVVDGLSYSKKIDIYHSFKNQLWDYGQPNNPYGVKGGDHFLVIWREGVADLYNARDLILGTIELSFKDP